MGHGRIKVALAGSAIAIAAMSTGLSVSAQTLPQDVWTSTFRNDNGLRVWTAPGGVVERTATQIARANGQRVWEAAVGGGLRAIETGAVSLGTTSVALTATRGVTAAAVARGVGTMLGGPAGLILTAGAIGLPPLIDWINQDGQKKIRVGPQYVEIKNGDGYEYQFQYGNQFSAWGSGDSGCTWWMGKKAADNTWATYAGIEWRPSAGGGVCIANEYQNGQLQGQTYTNPSGVREKEAAWVPASTENLASILPNYIMPIDLAERGLEKGASYAATNISINGPASVDNAVPIKEVENIDVPAQSSQTRTQSGNPFGLSANTPTVTGSSTGSVPITSGGQTINVPTRSTTNSTYNPNTNTTTSETVITADPIRKETVTTDKTTLNYTPTEATGKTTTTTTTNIINNITNNVINTTTKTTDNPKDQPTEEKPTDTPLGDQPKLYERKYPEGMTGIWQEKKSALSSTSLMTAAQSLMPTYNSGQCPTMMLPLDFASWASFGTRDVAPPCVVWGYAKVIIIVSALLLARRLVFGG